MSTLERAIVIAAVAHAGQLDKAGMPYILHPLRVALSLDREQAQIVGVLHDVVEDCAGWSLDNLASAGFSAAIIGAVDALTRRPGEHYDAYLDRLSENPLARQVKLSDVADNSDPARLARLPLSGERLRLKYEAAKERLERLTPAPSAEGEA